MKILFVCTGNAYRSPLAEALLKNLKPEIHVDSAGINSPLIPISAAAKKFLMKENADQYIKEVPEDLGNKKLNDYDLIVAMEPRHKVVVLARCPECENRTIVWNIYDPYFAPPEYTEKIFIQIKEKVRELANSI